ncbi:hypothetical protein PO909_006381 [Leuciscus waleckii]
MLILGDFNHCSLDKTLPGFYQYVKCNTRNNTILDKCYGNIKDAYTARARPPLNNSDHNVIQLLPKYRSVFKSSKPEIQSVKVWSSDKTEELKGCFLCTDWNIFFKDADIDSATESISAYISFCIDSVIPQKTVKRYPNNKPYITKGIKDCINRKKLAFRTGNKVAVRAAQKDLNLQIRASRLQFKERAEQELSVSNTKTLWDYIKKMTNMDNNKKPLFAQNEIAKANELNNFYDRPQQVKFNSSLSDSAVCSTGAPQGCVSSPLLFTLYTNDCITFEPNQYIVKFSDDTVLLSLLTKGNNINIHQVAIDKFVDWCDSHQLHINTIKTMEMLVDPRSAGDRSPVVIHGHDIKQVTSFKYLGVSIDNDLSWRTHVADICSRTHQRLYFLRRLRVFGVCKNIMLIFYRATIESILRYGITSWFGNLTVKTKGQIFNLVRTAGKIMGTPAPLNPQEFFEQAIFNQAKNTVSDNSHVLFPEFDLLNSGKRYRVPLCKYNRYKRSFVPLAIKLLNDQRCDHLGKKKRW